MSDLATLHTTAREIFCEALKSVDAHEAVRSSVHLEGSRLKLSNTTLELTNNRAGIYSIAIGKAARKMATALNEILGERLSAGIIAAPRASHFQTNASAAKQSATAKPFDDPFPDRWRAFEGGHPLPNRESLAAAQAAFTLLHRANREGAVVIFLISGGGSALMEWPRDEKTTLEDLRQMNEALVACGADIVEINAVRHAVSAIKGGGLSRRAPDCHQVSLIISDTGAGREEVVASGPTFEFPIDAPEARSVIARYKLEARLPEAILRALELPLEKAAQPSGRVLREHHVLLDNEHALTKASEAARSRGFAVEIARDIVEQPVDEGCAALLSRLFHSSSHTSASGRGVCLISGGEFKCPVRGRGTGGRNSESALRWAIELSASDEDRVHNTHIVALSAGTDGIDGNSSAAGAICDETTVRRAHELELDPQRFLNESDAFTFFQALGDTIVTGPTGTNVRDLRIMLAKRAGHAYNP